MSKKSSNVLTEIKFATHVCTNCNFRFPCDAHPNCSCASGTSFLPGSQVGFISYFCPKCEEKEHRIVAAEERMVKNRRSTTRTRRRESR
jgi:Zn finger protein HypA/HybF involved in hydrogenase expression